MAPSSRFFGIDMSTRRQAQMGKTRVVVGEAQEDGLHLVEVRSLGDDQAFLDLLTEQEFVGCGIDAPLSLPPCVLCRVCPCDCSLADWAVLLGFEADMVYHYRLSDLLLRKTIPHVAPKPPLSNGGPVDITPLTLRWLRLSRTLFLRRAPLERVVEVYATGAIQILAQALGLVKDSVFRYRASVEARISLLCALVEQCKWFVPDRLWDEIVASEDALDAAIACYSSWLAWQGKVLRPESLLGLDDRTSSTMVQPLQEGTPETRNAMLQMLQRSPWVALPDPLCF